MYFIEAKILSLVLLGIFSVLSLLDGVYLHFYKYRLHERKESKTEHRLHTARSLLFFLLLLSLYYFKARGAWLIAAIIFFLIDYLIESKDMLIEKVSRASIGGLTSFEYWLHGSLILTRNLSLGLWFVSMGTVVLAHEQFLIVQLLISSLLITGLHFLLIYFPALFSRFELSCCSRLHL